MCKVASKGEALTPILRINPSWTSVKETLYEVNKISPRLSWFTLKISKQAIQEIEGLACIWNSCNNFMCQIYLWSDNVWISNRRLDIVSNYLFSVGNSCNPKTLLCIWNLNKQWQHCREWQSNVYYYQCLTLVLCLYTCYSSVKYKVFNGITSTSLNQPQNKIG